jgi:undecaprenyl-diphosphatase
MGKMNIIETIVLGLIQGLTEFIPVSSSGHLVIAQNLFSGVSDHLFLEWINIGTFLALLVYFRRRLLAIFNDIFVDKNIRLARNIIITSVPAGVVGFLLADFIAKTSFFSSMITVIISLTVVGVLMIVLDKLPMASNLKNADKLSKKRAFLIGVAQMLALIPGISRSGSTIITGRLMGLDAKQAAEYSFLASLPIMLGVTLKLLVSGQDRQYFIDHALTLSIGNLVAFVSGLLAVGFLMRYLAKHNLAVFGWYRIGLAGVLSVILFYSI